MVEAEWRLLELSSGDPVEQTALDEVIVHQVGLGKSPPTVRFWRVNRPTISVGKHQDLYADVDVERARRNDISIVRRPSAGGSDYLSPNDLCYSVIIPAHMLGHDRLMLQKNYKFVYNKIERALKELGIQARFEKPCNIMTGTRKIGNMAQFTPSGVVLVHGKIRYELQMEQTLGHFTCVECTDKHSLLVHQENFAEAMTCVSEQGASPDHLYDTLRFQLLKDLKYSAGNITPEEKQLLADKSAAYKDTSWLEGRDFTVKREGFCDEHLNGIPIIKIYKPQQKIFKEQ